MPSPMEMITGSVFINGTVPAAAVNVESSFVKRVIGLVQEGGGTCREISFYIFGTGHQTTVVKREIVDHLEVVLLPFSPLSEHPGFWGHCPALNR